ncbi:DUF2202 domain-containing protein [[Muricauda] lutisoli]|uniref:DUF2202 domain-containing protein n=1 Tax=[Muricauda] lutisoli TaxID=2816035 RepID=A0ABS3EYG4_9FLAO|nr:DUF2202 domain-containing protein [[Muricauda] lutisoli]MBO0331163.1 DUF2202 domain-containing protein [[Muricauda] lutisoli]
MKRIAPVFIMILLVSLMIFGCSDSNDDPFDPQIENSIDDDTNDDVSDDVSTLTVDDEDALLFMLEEEKLARDTYKFLNEYWGMVQFENIMQSEQSHMDAVETLLVAYDIEYEILEDGVFENEDLQNWYDTFVQDGIVDEVAALTVGATIEDLDIVDLEEHIKATSNMDIADVFSSLQCGSRNHLRSFVQSIENLGETYTPQFLTQEEYETILDGSHEQCN